jgi:hypothetical protein
VQNGLIWRATFSPTRRGRSAYADVSKSRYDDGSLDRRPPISSRTSFAVAILPTVSRRQDGAYVVRRLTGSSRQCGAAHASDHPVFRGTVITHSNNDGWKFAQPARGLSKLPRSGGTLSFRITMTHSIFHNETTNHSRQSYNFISPAVTGDIS